MPSARKQSVGTCAGQYGYATTDFATILPKQAVDWNHALFVRMPDVGHGLTLNLGLRVEKETLPVPAGLQQPGVAKPNSIAFPWVTKSSRGWGCLGPASGKMKIRQLWCHQRRQGTALLRRLLGSTGVRELCLPAWPDANGIISNADMTRFVNNRAARMVGQRAS